MWSRLSTSRSDSCCAAKPLLCDIGGIDFFRIDEMTGGERKALPPRQLPRVGSFAKGSAKGGPGSVSPEDVRGGTRLLEHDSIVKDPHSSSVTAGRRTPRLTVVGAQMGDRESGDTTSRDLDHFV